MMAQFRTFDYGEAVGAGQKLAENQFRLGEMGRAVDVRSMQEEAIRSPQGKEQFQQKYPIEAGQSDAAARAAKLDKALKDIEVIGNVASGMTPENYLPNLQRLKDLGADITGAPAVYDENWVKSRLQEAQGYKGQLALEKERLKLKGGKRVNAQLDKKIVPAIETKEGRLINPSTGQDMPTALLAPSRQETGGPGEFGIEKKTKGELEGKIVGMEDSIQRLEGIKKRYDPQFQKTSFKIGAAWSKLKEKTTGEISESEAKDGKRFWQFKRRALESINLEIKRITGAQMSEAEADRIRQGFPDPGEGIFDGDGPTEFSAKLDDTIAIVKATNARYKYLLKNGVLGEGGKVSDALAETYPLEDFMGGDKGNAPAVNEPTASGPNGKKMVFRNGQWQLM